MLLLGMSLQGLQEDCRFALPAIEQSRCGRDIDTQLITRCASGKAVDEKAAESQLRRMPQMYPALCAIGSLLGKGEFTKSVARRYWLGVGEDTRPISGRVWTRYVDDLVTAGVVDETAAGKMLRAPHDERSLSHNALVAYKGQKSCIVQPVYVNRIIPEKQQAVVNTVQVESTGPGWYVSTSTQHVGKRTGLVVEPGQYAAVHLGQIVRGINSAERMALIRTMIQGS